MCLRSLNGRGASDEWSIAFLPHSGGRPQATTEKIPSESLPSKRYQAKDLDPKIMKTTTKEEQVHVKGNKKRMRRRLAKVPEEGKRMTEKGRQEKERRK